MGYTQWAAFAEKTVAHRNLVWPVPENWSAEQAAAFPVNFFTAYFAYWKAGLLQQPGARVLIHAVAGGVGTAAVQIGKILGIEMYGTSSSEDKLARVRELGLQHGINYKERDYVEAIKDLTHGEGVDAVFEMLGGEHVAKSVKCLCDFGRVIVYGAATGQTPQIDTRILYAKGASVHGLWLSYLSGNRPLMESALEAAFGMDCSRQTPSRDREGFPTGRSSRRLHPDATGEKLWKDCINDWLTHKSLR